MKGSKFAGVVLLALVLLLAPASAQACPRERVSMEIVVDSAELVDVDGDGVKGDVLVTGRVMLWTDGTSVRGPCILAFRVKYTTDPSLNPNTWLYRKVYLGFTATPGGSSNTFTYVISGLPYPGWYSLVAAGCFKGGFAVSEPFDFDPPGGSPGPIGN